MRTKPPRSQIRRVAKGPIAAAIGALLLSACAVPTHFHDKKSAALATQLQTEFAAYQADQGALYSTMAANVAAFEKEEDAMLLRFAGNYEDALLTKAPTMTWGQLWGRIEKQKKDLNSLSTKAADQIRADLLTQQLDAANVESFGKAVGKLRLKKKALEEEASKWDAMIANLQKAISELPGTLADLNSQKKGMDKISEVLSGSELNLGSFKDKLLGDIQATFADAPGITVRILELGLDLTELKKAVAERRVLAAQERLKVYEDFVVAMSVADTLLNNAGSKKGLIHDDDQTLASHSVIRIIQDFKNERAGEIKLGKLGEHITESQNNVHAAIIVPRLVLSAEYLVKRQDSLVTLRLARLKHLESISQSAIGDRANQAVISSGIDSLVAYHKGGITEEDIGNLIRAAQGLALFIIAS